jgi:hypothetical protein
MSLLKSILAVVFATLTFVGAAKADFTGEMAPEDFYGVVFVSATQGVKTSIEIARDGSWIVKGALAGDAGVMTGNWLTVQTRVISAQGDEATFLMLMSNRETKVMGVLTELDANQQAAVLQQFRVKARYVLSFFHPEGNVYLLGN